MRSRAAFAARLLGALAAGAAAAWGVEACSAATCGETLTCAGEATDAAIDRTLPDAGAVAMDGPDDAERPGEGETGVLTSDAGDAGAPDSPRAPCLVGGDVCTPVVPAGFQGPVVLALTTSDSGSAPAPPPCATPYLAHVLDAHARPVFLPASCRCTCGLVDGGCTSPAVETFTDNSCVNECNQVLAGACTLDACPSSSQSAKVTAPSQAVGGSCAESVQTILPPWDPTTDWSIAGRLCASGAAPADAGCAAGQVCAPPPPAAFPAALCVWQQADVPCPAAYPTKNLLYTSGTDGRGCTDSCSCGSPSGVTCTATLTLSSASTCSGETVLVAGSCNSYASTATPYVSATITAVGGACAPEGGASPAGAVAPSGPVTVCCSG